MIMKKTIVLKPIDAENVGAAFELQLEEHQKPYVMHPMKSLAYCYIYREHCLPFGIYDGEKMVGYTMIRYNPESSGCTIWHLLIDKACQKQGYGRIVMGILLDYIRSHPRGELKRIRIDCHPENTVAQRLYHSFGFREIGRGENIELELAL